jgi:hypothetical protein
MSRPLRIAYPNAWSSHKAYISIAKKWDWLHKGFILGILTSDKSKQMRAYRRFMAADEDGKVQFRQQRYRKPEGGFAGSRYRLFDI